MSLEVAIDILEGQSPYIHCETTLEWAQLVDDIHSLLTQYPKSTNNFINYAKDFMPPVVACYAVYTAVEKGVMEFTARNFQSMLQFNEEFKNIIPYMTSTDTTRRDQLIASICKGTELSLIELELLSPFNLQPEEEIGTGTCEQEGVNIDGLFDLPEGLKDLLNPSTVQAPAQTPSVDRDEYHVFTQYLYQFTPDDDCDLAISVVSQKFWDEHGYLDDQHISEYLEAIIPDWSDNWCETMESVFEYTGGSTKADAIAYLKATGFFKEEELFDLDDVSKAGILLGYLEGQPEEVISKFLKEALTHLDESQIEDLIQKYEDAWYEEDDE